MGLLRLDDSRDCRRENSTFQEPHRSPSRPHHTDVSRLLRSFCIHALVNLCKSFQASVLALRVRPIGIRCHPLSVHCIIKFCAEADHLVSSWAGSANRLLAQAIACPIATNRDSVRKSTATKLAIAGLASAASEPQAMSSDERQSEHGNHVSPNSNQGFSKHPLAEELIAWFTQNGGWLSPDVQIVYNQSQGHHMRALRPTTSEVVTCPLKLTLSSLNLEPDQKEVLPITSPLQQCRGKIPDHILTYLLLIEQRNKGKDSPWHNYIACLPGAESMTTPLWFDEEDVAFLAGTSLAPALKERRADYQKHWEHAVSVLREVGVSWADEVDL